MNSRLLSCRVKHERVSPTHHAFEYPVYTYLLDLDELPELDRKLRLFGYNRLRLASVHDRDYLEEGSGTVREKLARLLARKDMELTDEDSIFVVTSARFVNYVFNPVSFYWIIRDGELRGCVAEVNNTFSEKHVYPLPGSGENGGFPARYRAKKEFHVSPFYDRSGEYLFTIGDINERLDVTVLLEREGEKTFEARLVEEGRSPLTDAELLKTVLKRPLTAHLTFPRILWEAAKIHLRKKARFHTKPTPVSPMTIRHARNEKTAEKMTDKLARFLVDRYLKSLSKGSLEVTFPSGGKQVFAKRETGADATLKIRDEKAFYRRVAFHGDIGLGEAFSQGVWESDDLVRLFLFFLDNQNLHTPPSRFSRVFLSPVLGMMQRLRHQLAPKNSEAGTRENIAAHYDLSNELFGKFLDKTMTYSCACFTDPCDRDEDLSEAQRRKNRKLADMAKIGPGDHVLEIGCGWGGFAKQIAQERGCKITGLTVSREQYEYARREIREAGLENRVEIRLQDYRKTDGQFDKIISIEMLEAVGHTYHKNYFQTVDRLLARNGLAVIQTITIQDAYFERYRRGMDWIRKHIFPGGELPSLTRICQVTSRHTSLFIQNVDAIGQHYAATLKHWRDNFNANWDHIAALGFDDYFRRTWNYYLAICEAGFAHGHINNLQLVLGRAEPTAELLNCYCD